MQAFVFTQASASSSWTIPHNLSTTTPVIDVFVTYAGEFQKITPAQVNYIDENTVELIFSVPLSGEARIAS